MAEAETETEEYRKGRVDYMLKELRQDAAGGYGAKLYPDEVQPVIEAVEGMERARIEHAALKMLLDALHDGDWGDDTAMQIALTKARLSSVERILGVG